jgi:GAF domain-containing protein
LFREIYEKRQIVIIDDVQNDGRFEIWEPEMVNIHGWMGVPLISRDEVIGYLTLDSLIPHAYSTSNAMLAQTFAYQAAAAISNASLYEETRRRLRELEIINRISSTLRSSITEEQMLPDLLRETLDALGTPAGSIWLSKSSTDHIRQTASEGWFTGMRDLQVKKLMTSQDTSLILKNHTSSLIFR